ncbi:MAG: hypothetical protein R2838_03390 [Caldilineaceae bacterium]
MALSGDPEDICNTDQAILDLFPEDEHLAHAGFAWPSATSPSRGCQRICWLGYGERAKAGLAFNELVATGKVTGLA